MIVLSKLLPVFVYPLGLAIVLLGLALYFVRKNRPRPVTVLVGAAIFLLYFFSTELVAMSLLKLVERRYLPVSVESVHADAIVVLGGCSRPGMYPRMHAEMNEGGDRMLQGIRLFKAGAAPRVIVSGGTIDFILKGQVEGEDMRALMTEFGLPDSAIIVESKARNTYENGTFIKKILDERGLGNRIILVTSASHMIRSAAIFRKLGFELVPSPVDYLAEDKPYSWYSLMPYAANLENSNRCIKEIIGIVVYWLLGWL